MITNSDNVKTTFIRGESELCRAFLFETAIYWANEGMQVYYFTPKPYESLPPAFHDRKEPSATALKFITFIYTMNYEMLACQLVRLPTFQRLPTMILVEDLDHFSQASPGSSLEFNAARCCAVLLNTASACSRLSGRPIHLCATGVTGTSQEERQDGIYEVYFDKMWNIVSETREEGVDGVWMKQKGGPAIEFCWLVDDSVLVLKRIFGQEHDKQTWTDEP